MVADDLQAEGKSGPVDEAKLMQALKTHLEEGAFKYKAFTAGIEIDNGIARIENAKLEAPGGKAAVTSFFEFPTLKIDSEWVLTSGGGSEEDGRHVVLAFIGSLGQLGRLAPEIDTQALQRHVTIHRMEQDVERLEKLKVPGSDTGDREKPASLTQPPATQTSPPVSPVATPAPGQTTPATAASDPFAEPATTTPATAATDPFAEPVKTTPATAATDPFAEPVATTPAPAATDPFAEPVTTTPSPGTPPEKPSETQAVAPPTGQPAPIVKTPSAAVVTVPEKLPEPQAVSPPAGQPAPLPAAARRRSRRPGKSA